MKAVLLTLLLCSPVWAVTQTYLNMADQGDYNLGYLHDGADASITVQSVLGPSITWNVGHFTTADVNKYVIVNRQNATFDWDQMESYLLGDVYVSKTIDGDNLVAHNEYTWPIPGYPIYGRTELVDITFKLAAYVLEWYRDHYQGYIAGIYYMRFGMGLKGDYNLNGTIDAADYIIWRNTNGVTGENPQADGNYDSHVDQLDYVLWEGKYPNPNSGLGTMVVPEPSPIALWGCCAATVTLVLLLQKKRTIK